MPIWKIAGKRFVLLVIALFVLFNAISALTLWPEMPSGNILLLNALSAVAFALLLQSLLQAHLLTPLDELNRFVSALSEGKHERLGRNNSFKEIDTLADTLRTTGDSLLARLKDLTADRSQTDAILSGMIEGVLVLDQQGKIVLTNSAFRKRFRLEHLALVGKYHYEVLRHHQFNLLVESIRKEQRPVSSEIAFDRSRSYFEVHATPIPDGSLWIVFVFHDITEVKRLERVRSDFIANISHELKTPLSAVKGYVETLSDEWNEDAEKTKEYLEVLRRQADRMENIVSDLLQLSRIESGTDLVRKEAIEWKVYAEKIILSLAPLAKKKAITLQLLGNDCHFCADPEKLYRALSNLLDNALKYTQSEGTVKIEAFDSETTVTLKVSDTGIGIPKVDQARIFERFYRVDRARSRDLGGTGLGLSIVKHIIEAHEGAIGVESEIGKGTCFIITLPKSMPEHL
ncbi:MAG: ATP-binding protein [Nitrospirota bacterium]